MQTLSHLLGTAHLHNWTAESCGISLLYMPQLISATSCNISICGNFFYALLAAFATGGTTAFLMGSIAVVAVLNPSPCCIMQLALQAPPMVAYRLNLGPSRSSCLSSVQSTGHLTCSVSS